ncbi:aldolase/citrate lyase family protein [Aneurinibacillus aneurinilyticus]|uniref:hypothetical protein n=1 Tax=Aneurinibacillus aneurinilyticus TaxID=1391 RepID=UPI002E248738|nr:aldolase/citrate lyase family protein [Aneurinibacillus aneurinilyticus]
MLDLHTFIQNENDRVLTIVQIETEQAVHNLDEIVAVENARAMGEHMLKGFERLQQEH